MALSELTKEVFHGKLQKKDAIYHVGYVVKCKNTTIVKVEKTIMHLISSQPQFLRFNKLTKMAHAFFIG